MSYRELELAANGLARRLLDDGLAPNTRIAVLLDRSVDLVVSLLAVLKAGSAYVPLDATYPAERLAHVLGNAHPAAVISKSALLAGSSLSNSLDLTAHSLRGTPAILLDDGWLTDSAYSRQDYINKSTPDAVAYIIYTSGSTGVPKGVSVQHRSATNLLLSMRSEPGLSAQDTLLSVTTVAFDIAFLEIFLPLLVGAKIVLAREADVVDGTALADLLATHAVTVLQATPTTWQLLIDAGWRNPHLKMLCGGEAMSRKLAEALLARGGELWNMYGPTETTVWSSVMRVTSGHGPVLLGPPIANTSFWILNENLEPVADGESGELFIGGAGVALGYVDLAELTASKFLPDRFSHDRTARLYRTGDWVRQRRERSGECLEFLGRFDTQVKIRGYRIELGEIEATLLRNPEVVQAVAIVGRVKSTPMIHAFVVLQPATLTLSDELRMRFRSVINEHLPSYMHPATIAALTHFPQTYNGKVDRQALSSLAQPSDTVSPEPLSAANPRVDSPEDIKQRLRTIWSSLLDLGDIPADANFFLLGGNSLLAMRLLERIEREFGVPLTPAALFGAPTLGEQVAVLQRWSGEQFDFRQVVRLNPDGRRPPLIAIHNTGVYCYHLAQSLGADQPLTALQLFDPSRLELPTTVADIAAEYVRLIKQVHPIGPYRLIGWCVGGVLAFEVARQLCAGPDDVSYLGLIDAWAPGNRRHLSKLHAWLSDRSYRAQLIWADWRNVRARQQTVGGFLRNRVLVRKLLRLPADARSASLAKKFAERHQNSEHYDRWLAGYLDEAAERYSPGPYRGKVQLLVSSREPSGWLLDPLKGWRQFVSGRLETAELEGDHFTVFRGVGLQQLATVLSAALAPQLQSRK